MYCEQYSEIFSTHSAAFSAHLRDLSPSYPLARAKSTRCSSSQSTLNFSAGLSLYKILGSSTTCSFVFSLIQTSYPLALCPSILSPRSPMIRSSRETSSCQITFIILDQKVPAHLVAATSLVSLEAPRLLFSPGQKILSISQIIIHSQISLENVFLTDLFSRTYSTFSKNLVLSALL